jgi:hypothetical protein
VTFDPHAAPGALASPLEPDLLRLVYLSTNLITGSEAAIEAEIAHILAASRRNNRAARITGVLIFSAGTFLQTLEGPADAVEALYRRIASDPRHADTQILESRDIGSRDFGEWSMAFSGGKPAEQASFTALLDAQDKADRARATAEILSQARRELEREACAADEAG